MANIEIYATDSSFYCVRAKPLLDCKGVAYTEIHIDRESEKRDEMIKRSEGRTE